MTGDMPDTIWAKLYCADEGTCHMDATQFDMEGRTEYTRTSTITAKLEAAEKMAVALDWVYIEISREFDEFEEDIMQRAKIALSNWKRVNGEKG